MCGIAGILLPPGKLIEPGWLKSFDTALRHRGPDDYGFVGWRGGADIAFPTRDVNMASGGPLAFVHRRLSIQDLTSAGWQPMLSEDRQHAIVFNGEVYNFFELRRDLEQLGHIFRSHSDTEVVLAAWRQWGIEAFRKFVGMFALAILDLERKVVILARDPFGIKPLYWAKWRTGVVFASEIPALLALPDIDRRMSPAVAHDFLAYGIVDRNEQTMLSGIKRITPGCCYEFCLEDASLCSILRYWDPGIETEDVCARDAVERIRTAFFDSVSLHLRSDVPVGVALSGGIDSTSILGAVTHLGASNNVKAFSFISEDPAQSEEKWIDLAAEHYQIEVHKIRPERGDMAKDLGRLIRSQGEPFATTGMFAQARVFECASALGIKVTLDGQGADELLAGYPTYLAARAADLCSEMHPGLALATSGAIKVFARAALMVVCPQAESFFKEMRVSRGWNPWLSRDWFHQRGILMDAFPKLERRRDRLHDRLEQTLYDLSLPALLRYADRNSMAYSVESRVPFLTPAMVKLILSLPSHLLVGADGLTKSIFRQAMRGLVPDAILARRDKIGFAVPENLWLRERPEWLRNSTEQALDILPMLNRKEAHAEVDRIIAGKQVADSRLWRSICMSVWCSEFSIQC